MFNAEALYNINSTSISAIISGLLFITMILIFYYLYQHITSLQSDIIVLKKVGPIKEDNTNQIQLINENIEGIKKVSDKLEGFIKFYLQNNNQYRTLQTLAQPVKPVEQNRVAEDQVAEDQVAEDDDDIIIQSDIEDDE